MGINGEGYECYSSNFFDYQEVLAMTLCKMETSLKHFTKYFQYSSTDAASSI